MKLHYVLFLVLLLPSVSYAELKNENLLVTVPKGYKIDFKIRKGNMIMTEMVPESESVKNWTEMVTTQVFLGLKNVTPKQFEQRMNKIWMSVCKEAEMVSIREGKENGYPFAVWLQECPLNKSTGKRELTLFKAIKGNDSFYVIQKAFRFVPSKEQFSKWVRFIRSASVCDTRHENHSCPDGFQTSDVES